MGMKTRAFAVLAAAAIGVSATATQAHAVKPARGCGEGFEALRTIQSIAEEAEDVTGIPAEAFLPVLEAADKNGDSLLCFSVIASGARAAFVDNTANL